MIKLLLYPVIEADVLRLEMTDEQNALFEKMTPEEQAEFVKANINEEYKNQIDTELLLLMYQGGLGKMTLQKGVCRQCGCTREDPCHHPEYGPCWWTDENENLCSHCEAEEIAKDPQTVRPRGVKPAIFPSR